MHPRTCMPVVSAMALLVTLTTAVPTAGQTEQAACDCIGQWQTSVLTAKNQALCKDVHGAACLGAEVRITKPWTWEPARQACVGSFEYWQGLRGGKPEWQSAGSYAGQSVELAKARQRCQEIGAVAGDAPQPRPTPTPAVKAADKLRDTVRQAMRDRPSANQARKALSGRDSVITVEANGKVVESTTAGTKALTSVCPRPVVIDLTVMGRALRSKGINTEEISRILDDLNAAANFEANAAGGAGDRYAANMRDAFVMHLLGLTLVVAPGDVGLRPAAWSSAHTLRACEHASIKGTINGGGDFISVPQMDNRFSGAGRLMYIRAGAAAASTADTIAISSNVIAPPSAEFRLANATAAVEVAANGVSAIALLKGRARATELATGESREVAAGQMVVVIPGIGVAAPEALSPSVRAFIEARLNDRGAEGGEDRPFSGSTRLGNTPGAPTGTRVLRGGEEWAFRTSEGTLALHARLPWPKVAGGANALEVRVNGRVLVSPLRNKSGSFTFADGRDFEYLDGKTGHWMVFYSPDFVSNNTGDGGDYQVVTDPESAYRYAWDISAFAGAGKMADVVIRNAITSGTVSLEVSFDSPAQTGRRTDSRMLNRESEASWGGDRPSDERTTVARGEDAGELTGAWTMDYWVFGYPKPREFTLQQRGTALSGTMLSAGGNPIRLEGAVNGEAMTLDFVYDNVATLSELTSPAVARKIVGIRSRARFQRAGPDTWKGTLSSFYLSTTGDEVYAKADGGTLEATKRSAPGPTTMKRVR